MRIGILYVYTGNGATLLTPKHNSEEYDMFLEYEEDRIKLQPSSPFTYAEANRLAKQLVGKGDIVQVFVFGSIAEKKVGRDIDIVFSVSDLQFRDYINEVRLCALKNPNFPSALQRLTAFDGLWKDHVPGWQDLLRPRKDNLFDFLDLFVVPWEWQRRIPEVAYTYGASESFFRKVSRHAIVLQTRH